MNNETNNREEFRSVNVAILSEASALPVAPSGVGAHRWLSGDSTVEKLLTATLLSSLIVILYAPVLRSMTRQWWEDPNYGHALVVPFFVIYILWRERARWSAMPARGSDSGLLVMIMALGLLILGMLAAELFTSRASLVLLIVGLIVFLAGWQVLRSIAFPMGYLLFMIPLPTLIYYQITFPLQLLASRLGASGLVMAGVPTIRQGNLLILPNCTLEVVDACSGVRSLISLLAVVVAYGYLAEPRVWLRCLLVAVTIPVVIGSNGLRLVAMGVLSFLYGPGVDAGLAHVALGLGFFGVAFLSILAAHRLILYIVNRRVPNPAH